MSATGEVFRGREVVVLVAGVPFSGHRLPAQHMAEQLAQRAAVLYVDPGSPSAALSLDSSLRLESPNLAVFQPKVPPGRTRPLVRDVVRATLDVQIRRALRRLGGRVVAVVIEPPQRAVRVAAGPVRRVHYVTDAFVAGADLMGLSASWIRQREAALAREVDVVVAVSELLGEEWRSREVEVVVIPNGCDADLFEATPSTPPSPLVRLPRPVAVVAGTLSDRIDVRLLAAVAQRMSLLLVGPRSRSSPNPHLDALMELDSVQWVDAQPFESMPALLSACDVGLTPYTDTPFNRASFPLKTLEYLAAGLPVVSTPLPSVQALGTELVAVAFSPEEFATLAAEAGAASPAGSVERRQAFAGQFSWEAQGTRFAEVLGLT